MILRLELTSATCLLEEIKSFESFVVLELGDVSCPSCVVPSGTWSAGVGFGHFCSLLQECSLGVCSVLSMT